MNNLFSRTSILKFAICILMLFFVNHYAQAKKKPQFKVIAFYTGKNDQAHVSYVKEANEWFPKMAAKHNFSYESTTDWDKLNTNFLSGYQVVLFLDTRPEKKEQREAFQSYMENGGGWFGFHFAAFALTPSMYPQNWDWYHEQFLGSGEYSGNTWRPTSAVLRKESSHVLTKKLASTFTASPNEWYKWKNDLTKNHDIQILYAVDDSSFPLGTGPKAHEIWHNGYYPIIWSNKKYKMIYSNMGHNDIDYEHKYDNTNKTLSHTFDSDEYGKFVIDALFWLARKK